ncbi:MAG: hypothetical protein IKV20_01560 [Clostridia bacterium]|nr:hypothetical protein [Clostridia bacterium]
MSENKQGGIDLSRIVGLIMENPRLISEINELVRESGQTEEVASAPEEAVPVTSQTPPPQIKQRDRRAALLCALKPYVSEKRAQAIDSMITITEMIDMMKAR